MSNDLSLPGFTNLSLVHAQDQVNRYGTQAEVVEITKEGVKHIVAQEMQAAKTATAINLTTNVFQHALKVGDKFSREAFNFMEANSRSQESHAYFQDLTQSLLSRYSNHINGLIEVGVTGIAREVHKEVIVPKVEKKGRF